METKKLLSCICEVLEDIKAQNIVQFDTRAKSPLFDAMVIASGTSSRQVEALANKAAQAVKKKGGEVLAIEGSNDWFLVDFGAVVLNVMVTQARDYYQLEELWAP